MRNVLISILFLLPMTVVTATAVELTREQKQSMLRHYLNMTYDFRPSSKDPFLKQLDRAFLNDEKMRSLLSKTDLHLSGAVPMVRGPTNEFDFHQRLSEIIMNEVEKRIDDPRISIDENIELAEKFLKKNKYIETNRVLLKLDQRIEKALFSPDSAPISHSQLSQRVNGVYVRIDRMNFGQKEEIVSRWTKLALAGKPYSANYAKLLQRYVGDTIFFARELDVLSERILNSILDEKMPVDRVLLKAQIDSLMDIDQTAYLKYEQRVNSILNTEEKMRAALRDIDPVGEKGANETFRKELLNELEAKGFFKKRYSSNAQLRSELFKNIVEIYRGRGKPFGPSLGYDFLALERMGFFKEQKNLGPARSVFQSMIKREFKKGQIFWDKGLLSESDPISPKLFQFASEGDARFALAYRDLYLKRFVIPTFLGETDLKKAETLPQKIAKVNQRDYEAIFYTMIEGEMDDYKGQGQTLVSNFNDEMIQAIDREYMRHLRWGSVDDLNPELGKTAALVMENSHVHGIFAARARVAASILNGTVESVAQTWKSRPQLAVDYRRVFKSLIAEKPEVIFKQHHLLHQILRTDLKQVYPDSSEFARDLLKLRDKIFYHHDLDWRSARATLTLQFPHLKNSSSLVSEELLKVVNATHFQMSQLPLEKLDLETLVKIKHSVEWKGASSTWLKEFYGKIPYDEAASVILAEKVDRVFFDRKMISLEEYQHSFWKYAQWVDRMGGVEIEQAMQGYSSSLKSEMMKAVKNHSALEPGLERILKSLPELDAARFSHAYQTFSENLQTLSHEVKIAVAPRFEKVTPPAPPPKPKSGFARFLSRLCGKK